MGNKLYEIFFFDLCVKNWNLWSKFTSSKKVLWFFSKGLRFRILLTLDYQTAYHRVSKSAFRYSGDFFSIRFQSHQAVDGLFWLNLYRVKNPGTKGRSLVMHFSRLFIGQEPWKFRYGKQSIQLQFCLFLHSHSLKWEICLTDILLVANVI